MYWTEGVVGTGFIAPHILNLNIKWWWVVSFSRWMYDNIRLFPTVEYFG
jgi:hypothetical protein